MLYLSELTNKTYKSEQELVDAETEFKRAKEEKEAKTKALTEARKARAKEIDDAREEMVAAEKKYHNLVNAFVKDYGNYHFSLVKNGDNDDIFDDFFDSFFKLF